MHFWDTMAKKKSVSATGSVGERLRRLRQHAGYSLRALGEEVGVSYTVIHYYETQEGRIPSDILIKLADALGVTADEILGRTNDRKATTPKNRRLLRKLLQVEKLPPRDRESVLRMIDGMVAKQKVGS
jgi:transcriptional regulator with XRE-family HTH domain